MPAIVLALVLQAGLAGCDKDLDPRESAPVMEAGAGRTSGGLAVDIGPAPANGVGPDAAPPGDAFPSGTAPGAGDIEQLEAAIAGLDCSRLQVIDLPRTGEIELRGHVPMAALASDLVTASQRLVGDSARVIGNLMVLPAPLCAVLETVEAMALPQSNDQWNDPLAVGLQGWAGMPRGLDGEATVFRFQAPEFDAHIYVDYFDSDGNVIHLMPSDFQARNRFRANSGFEIGGSDSGPQLYIAPPFGLDLALVIASTEPLHGGTLPFAEDAEGYLARLSANVQAQRRAHPDFRGEWVFMLMLTEPG